MHGTGNLSALEVHVGLDACAKVGPLLECGSKLTKALPVWVVQHTFDFSSVCQ